MCSANNAHNAIGRIAVKCLITEVAQTCSSLVDVQYVKHAETSSDGT